MSEVNESQERDAVERERQAFFRGTRWQNGYEGDARREAKARGAEILGRWDSEAVNKQAALCYPLPKVKRPRVVADPHSDYVQEWRCVTNVIEFASGPGCDFSPAFDRSGGYQSITPSYCTWPTPERIAMWADLIANPDELIDAE